MLLNVNVPKADHTFSIEIESLPPVSLEYIIRYGATQAVVDTTAGVKRTEFKTDAEFNAAALAKAQKRWDQIVSGNVPGTRTTTKTPVKTLAEQAGEMTDEELAKLGLVRVPVAVAA